MRAARVATVGLLAGTLIISGASLAVAEDATDATATATEGEASSNPNSPGTGEQATIEAPPVSDPPSSAPAPALPSAPEQVSTPEQPAPQPAPPAKTAPSSPAVPAETAPDSAPAEQKPAEDAATKPEQSAKSTEAAAVPALRWRTIDEASAVVPGATITLEGPRDTETEDRGDDEQWADAAATTIVDNTGADDYTGLDLDPAPGVFRIEQFADEETAKADPATEPVPVAVDSDYRVRLAESGEYRSGDAAEWTTLDVLEDADTEAQDVALTSLEPALRAQDEQEVTPMRLGPDTGGTNGAAVSAPYVYWTVESGSNLVGGASFTIQGPRDNGWLFPGWGGSATIVDNGPLDLDKDDGEFLVKSFDGHDIDSDRRYRIQQTQAPSGYRFTQSSSWVDISGSRQAPNSNQWPGGVHDFGDFAVEKLPTFNPVCQAGYTYAISGGGQLQQIVGGTRTNVGSSLNSSDMNGLGIGAGGSSVYAIKRSGSTNSETATVYSFNTNTGTWSNTGDSQSTTVSLVAGAVNLSSGNYVFGGYTGNGSEFRMWQYNPASGNFSYLGYIQTSMGSGSNNGDIAFNAAGDLFVVHGRGNNVTVFSVTAANFNAASGGLIASAKSATISTNSSDVNGVAFDAAGKGYLGNGSQLRSYDMPSWSNSSLVTSNLSSSTDLASCSSPATIKLQKVVQGGRADATDQFRLELKQGNTTLGTATTAGTTTGVQPQVVGPLPAVRGATLTFSEAFVNGAAASDYATSYQCLVDGESMSPAVTGTTTSGSITIPHTGEAIVCEFVNTPLTASVSITKRVQNTAGENEAPASGWTVGAVPTATTGSVTSSVNASLQTDASGTATWPLAFGTAASRATLSVSETQQTGYEFVSGVCTITPMTGEPVEVTLTGAASTPLTNIKPGDQIECSYTNKQLPGSISWQKITDDDPAVHIGGSTWSVQGPGAGGQTVTVEDCVGATAADCADARDKDERAGHLRMTDLAWGEYTITETVAPDGFELDATPRTVTITAANAADGATIDPVVNVRTLGQVSWFKTDGTSALEGSEWSLSGPGGADVHIEDCVGATVTACAGMPDQDPGAGAFLVKELGWGDYSLVETAAPLGYVLDSTPHPFTVDATTVGSVIALGAIVNTLAVAPALPMTGGLSGDFYTFAGLGVLLLALALLAIRRLWVRRRFAEAGIR